MHRTRNHDPAVPVTRIIGKWKTQLDKAQSIRTITGIAEIVNLNITEAQK